MIYPALVAIAGAAFAIALLFHVLAYWVVHKAPRCVCDRPECGGGCQ